MSARTPAESLWLENGLPQDSLQYLFLSERPDPAVNSSFKLGSAAQTAIGLSALAAARFHELRTGEAQTVTVDARHAVLEFKSENWHTIDNQLPGGFQWDDLAGVYKTKDDSYVRIHTNFPHHRQGILDILACAPTKAAVADALKQWNAVEFETEAANRKMCATAFRSFAQWDEHPQCKALANTPPVVIRKVGDAPKRASTGHHTHPLDGIRVLDLTRVIAGPVCGRTLAARGADVLLLTSPNLPDLPMLDIETSRGKRTAQLDLNIPSDQQILASLSMEADVFLQSYRPGGLHDKGFGVDDLARMRPGIVYASLSAYGFQGPWKNRRGFDSLVQTATGFNHAEAEAWNAFQSASATKEFVPRPLPMQAVDHAAGYLLAFGINAALCKTITEGGSWEVQVSLAAVGQWIRSLGRLSPEIAFGEGKPLPPRGYPQDDEIAHLAVAWESSSSKLDAVGPRTMTAIKHAAILSKTHVKAGEAPMVLDAHSTSWLPRV